jgi:hypothetical protein
MAGQKTLESPRRPPPSVRSSPRNWRSTRERVIPTAASLLPHHTCSQAPGALSIAVRMPPSSSITFIRSSLQSVAKIFPPTRNEGRP